MPSAFVVWRGGKPVPGVSLARPITPIDDDFELLEGVSRITTWPADIAFGLDPATPRDVMLADALFGSVFIVVSAKVQRVIDSASANPVELLPVLVMNHKGRVASRDYAIVNPTDLVDCIDVDASAVEWNALDPTAIYACERLRLREERVPPTCDVFRLSSWRNVVMVRRHLAERLLDGTTGLWFDEPETYQGCV